MIYTSQTDLTTIHTSVSKRLTFQEHDFFQPQPVRHAEIYLLRMILHDWPAEEAISILTNIAQVLKPGSRIIIMDTILPAPGSIPRSEESLLRVRDLTMMQAFNSCERSLEDWADLLAKTDARLKMQSVRQPFGSAMAIMEVVLNNTGPNSAVNGNGMEVNRDGARH